MPSAVTLEAFVAAVESGAHAQAIEDYYTEDATMRENTAPPRQGRKLLVRASRRCSIAPPGWNHAACGRSS